MFGTLDHDVKDLQIVRYEATTVIVKAAAKDGRPIKDVVLAGEYTAEIADGRRQDRPQERRLDRRSSSSGRPTAGTARTASRPIAR